MAVVETPKTAYCLADGVGRVSWIEALGPEPAGDCAGPMYAISADAHLCERHLLQHNLAGRRILATAVKP